MKCFVIFFIIYTCTIQCSISSSWALPPPKPDPVSTVCNEILNNFFRIFSYNAKIKIPKSTYLSKTYLDQVYFEWVHLDDPVYHQKVLNYPVPEIALQVLKEMAQKKLKSFQNDESDVFHWAEKILKQPLFENRIGLLKLIDHYLASIMIEREQIKFVTGIYKIPETQNGMVRVYKGSHFFKGPSLSQSQIKKDEIDVLSGEEYFLNQEEANVHSVKAEAFHPDGVSISLDPTVILNYGSHVRIYDVPQTVYDRLPYGARELSERVFRYSVPEKFRIKTLPKQS